MRRRISELPAATELPGNNEFILPVFTGNTDHVLRSISLEKIIDRIRCGVLAGNDIEIVESHGGIKFQISRADKGGKDD